MEHIKYNVQQYLFLNKMRIILCIILYFFFFFQAEDGIRDYKVTGVQTCALPIYGVRGAHHLLPDRGAARARPALADHQGEAAPVAVPTLIPRRTTLMRTRILLGLAILALLLGPLAPAGSAQTPGSKEAFIPLLVYRTGPYAPSGIPIANGVVDYFTLINERDGGANGVERQLQEGETECDTKQGVGGYEKLKGTDGRRGEGTGPLIAK